MHYKPEETDKQFTFEIEDYSYDQYIEIKFEAILTRARIKWNDPSIEIHDLRMRLCPINISPSGCHESNYEYHLLITLRKNEPKKALTLRGE